MVAGKVSRLHFRVGGGGVRISIRIGVATFTFSFIEDALVRMSIYGTSKYPQKLKVLISKSTPTMTYELSSNNKSSST